MKLYILKNKILVIISGLIFLSTFACRSDLNQNQSSEGYALLDISSAGNEVAVDKAKALQLLEAKYKNLSTQIPNVLHGATMSYMGGYEQHADSSGAYFKISCGIMRDGLKGCHRSSDYRSLSTSMMGQIPPSMDSRLDDLITLSYEVFINSLNPKADPNLASYSQIEVYEKATLKGTIGSRSVSKSNCLKINAKDNRFKMSYEFYDCGDSYFARSVRKGNLAALRTYWGIEK